MSAKLNRTFLGDTDPKTRHSRKIWLVINLYLGSAVLAVVVAHICPTRWFAITVEWYALISGILLLSYGLCLDFLFQLFLGGIKGRFRQNQRS